MSTFKVGDRVRIYGFSGPYSLTNSLIAQVAVDSTDCYVGVKRESDGVFLTVHPKQCRRLKPAQKRRRIWVELEAVTITSNTVSCIAYITPSPFNKNLVEFIEVRPSKAASNTDNVRGKK